MTGDVLFLFFLCADTASLRVFHWDDSIYVTWLSHNALFLFLWRKKEDQYPEEGDTTDDLHQDVVEVARQSVPPFNRYYFDSNLFRIIYVANKFKVLKISSTKYGQQHNAEHADAALPESL